MKISFQNSASFLNVQVFLFELASPLPTCLALCIINDSHLIDLSELHLHRIDFLN